MNKLRELWDQLRNLDPNDPGRWPGGVRLGAVILLFVIAASFGYYYFVWKAKRPLLLEARAEETQLWSTLNQKARKAANLQAYKDQLAEIEKSFGAMLRQLPNKTEVPNLLVDISQSGLAAGLEENLFQPLVDQRVMAAAESRPAGSAVIPIRYQMQERPGERLVVLVRRIMDVDELFECGHESFPALRITILPQAAPGRVHVPLMVEFLRRETAVFERLQVIPVPGVQFRCG